MLPTATVKETAKVIDFANYMDKSTKKYIRRSSVQQIYKLTAYNTTKTSTSLSNFSVKMQYSFFVNNLPVAASMDKLMEEAHIIRKMSEVIQKEINQSLNRQKQSFKGVLMKRCPEICSKFTGEHI